MFIAVLSAIAKILNKPKNPPVDDWIKNMWCVCLLIRSVVSNSCDPETSPLGSSVHGILQAGILEWVAISFSIYIYIYYYVIKKE